MQVLRIGALPDAAVAAAAKFYGDWVGVNPPRNGEGDHPQDGGGAQAGIPGPSMSRNAEGAPPPPLRGGPPPRAGEDLLLIFPPADQSHRAWRIAAVQALAREHAPRRVNALAGADEAAIAAALAFLEQAPGVTGQYLVLYGAGAGDVIG